MAVKDVEQALVGLDGAAQRGEDSIRAAEQYRRYVTAIESSWRAGFETLLMLEEAHGSAILAEITLIGLQRDRVRYWVLLYKALGVGWQVDGDVPGNWFVLIPTVSAIPDTDTPGRGHASTSRRLSLGAKSRFPLERTRITGSGRTSHSLSIMRPQIVVADASMPTLSHKKLG